MVIMYIIKVCYLMMMEKKWPKIILLYYTELISFLRTIYFGPDDNTYTYEIYDNVDDLLDEELSKEESPSEAIYRLTR